MNMFLIISDHLPIIAPVWLRNDYEIVRRATFKKSRYCLWNGWWLPPLPGMVLGTIRMEFPQLLQSC